MSSFVDKRWVQVGSNQRLDEMEIAGSGKSSNINVDSLADLGSQSI